MPENPVNWTQIIVTMITNLASILFGMTILILVVKGKFDVLKEMMDGHFHTVIDALKESKHTENKVVDALIANSNKPEVVIPGTESDRRKEQK